MPYLPSPSSEWGHILINSTTSEGTKVGEEGYWPTRKLESGSRLNWIANSLVAVNIITGEFSMPRKAKVIVNYNHSQLNRFEDWSIPLNPNGEESRLVQSTEGANLWAGSFFPVDDSHYIYACMVFPFQFRQLLNFYSHVELGWVEWTDGTRLPLKVST